MNWFKHTVFLCIQAQKTLSRKGIITPIILWSCTPAVSSFMSKGLDLMFFQPDPKQNIRKKEIISPWASSVLFLHSVGCLFLLITQGFFCACLCIITPNVCLLLSDYYPAECLCMMLGLNIRCWSSPRACRHDWDPVFGWQLRESICLWHAINADGWLLLRPVFSKLLKYLPTSVWNAKIQDSEGGMSESCGR